METFIHVFIFVSGYFRSSVTRTPQTEKAAIQASSKNVDKVPGAVIITGMVDEEKENSSVELSPSVAPLAVQESFEERNKPAVTTATTTSVPTTTKDNSPRVVTSVIHAHVQIVYIDWACLAYLCRLQADHPRVHHLHRLQMWTLCHPLRLNRAR